MVNGKYYIGKDSKNHKNYLGSGIAIKKAIEKYGKQNFIKEILYYCKDIDGLNKKEAEIINEKIINDPNSYNLALGGQGGDLSKFNKKINNRLGKKWEEIFGKDRASELRKNHSKKLSGVNNGMFGKNLTAGENNGMFGKKGILCPNYGKIRTPEQKEKYRQVNLGKKDSEITKSKKKQAAKNRKYPYEIHQIDNNGNLLGSFRTIEEAITKLSISRKKAYYGSFENFKLIKVVKEDKRT
jgi:hypothetical protein